MALLDEARWHDQLFTDGAWRAGSGETVDVVEPATGGVLGRLALATPADVAAEPSSSPPPPGPAPTLSSPPALDAGTA